MNLAGPVVAAVVLLLPPTGLAAAPGQVRCTVTDPRVDEASGLVDGVGRARDLMVTANDSGDTGRVFVLDQRCRTVGVRTYAATARDVEALAPDDAGHVWVGDTGDNTSTRADVVLRRVPVGRGDRRVRAASYRLVYPDGPHDAETLLRDPRSGRLLVVTKQLLSSQVYAAPRRLDPDRLNRLTPVARVSMTPTDGSFAGPDRVLLRDYDSVAAYAVPGWRRLGSARLPEEPQGESLSVGPGGRVRTTSEGIDQPVLQVRLPRGLLADPAHRGADAPAGSREDHRMPVRVPVTVALVLLGALAVLAALLRRAR